MQLVVWTAVGLVAVLSVAAVVFLAVSWHVSNPTLFGPRGYATVFGVVFGAAGALIASRRPGNAIGWLCLACGVIAAIHGLGEAYALSALRGGGRPPPLAPWAAWTSEWVWMIYLEAMGVLAAIFPDGTWRSRGWRNVIVVCCIGVVVGIAGNMVLPELTIFPQFQNPLGLRGVDADAFLQVVTGEVWFFGLGLILAGAASAAARFRHSRGDERQQLKWLAFAAALIALTTTSTGVISGFTGIVPPSLEWVEHLTIGSLLGIPVAVAIAVLKYRLYDIDVIINRALVYGAVTTVLALVYTGVVIGLQALLPQVAQDSALAVALSTLAIVTLFHPVRRRVRVVVDRSFYRRRYDAEQTIERFGAQLRSESDVDALRRILVAVAGDTMQPAHASLWLRPLPAEHAPTTAVRRPARR